MGSLVGTSRIVVDRLREKGFKVGLVKLRFYRPFPREYFKGLSKRVKAMGVIDRDISFGYEGAVASDIKSPWPVQGWFQGHKLHRRDRGKGYHQGEHRGMYEKLFSFIQGKTRKRCNSSG